MLGAGLLAVGLLTILLSASQAARSTLAEAYPPPGQLILVDGHEMHLNCMGEGSPTVILESGLGGFSIHWALVQPEIAKFTRVCAYDRAGLGWSAPGPEPRTAEQSAGELHVLLNNADIGGPYVLTGHSFGGLIARLYASRYPNEIAGVVLVDALHEDRDTRLPAYAAAARDLERQFQSYTLLRRAGLLALLAERIPDTGLPPEAGAQWRALLATRQYFETANAESHSLDTSFAEIRSTGADGLGDLPLVVVSRGMAAPVPGASPSDTAAQEAVWQELQTDLLTLSVESQQIIAEKSGHDIPLQQPELIAAAVQQLIAPAPVAADHAHEPASSSEPAVVAAAPTATPTVAPEADVPPAATPLPTATAAPTAAPTSAAALAEVTFTLRTEFRGGKMIYVGVSGEIDGVVNPTLTVAPATLVHAVLLNGDGINHDLYFPDFEAHTAVIGRREETTGVSFVVGADQAGTFVYYCTLPGHREAGQEGQFVVAGEA